MSLIEEAAKRLEQLRSAGIEVPISAAEQVSAMKQPDAAATRIPMPERLVEAASALDLPVVRVPERTPFIAISRFVWEALAADHYNHGSALLDAGKYDEAVKRFSAALALRASVASSNSGTAASVSHSRYRSTGGRP